ncbi:MAG: hypothetical protein GX362_03400 [Methanosarcinaceae archaeon]|nr:hypothetical protein [Methanosarcinaceae archaeon]
MQRRIIDTKNLTGAAFILFSQKNGLGNIFGGAALLRILTDAAFYSF